MVVQAAAPQGIPPRQLTPHRPGGAESAPPPPLRGVACGLSLSLDTLDPCTVVDVLRAAANLYRQRLRNGHLAQGDTLATDVWSKIADLLDVVAEDCAVQTARLIERDP